MILDRNCFQKHVYLSLDLYRRRTSMGTRNIPLGSHPSRQSWQLYHRDRTREMRLSDAKRERHPASLRLLLRSPFHATDDGGRDAPFRRRPDSQLVGATRCRRSSSLRYGPCSYSTYFLAAMYSAVQINVVKSCVCAFLYHATFDHVLF